MAVAENPVATTTQSPPRDLNLGLASLVGGIVILAGLGLIFGALPFIWHDVLPTSRMNDFLSSALLLIAGIATIVAVSFIWHKLDRAYRAPGQRAGSFVAAAVLFIATWIVFALGNAMEVQGSVGMFMTFVVAGLLAVAILFTFTRAGFARWLLRLEHNGWFTNEPFKGNQGVRVRRGTVLGLLVIGITGIITMVSHNWFGSSRAGSAEWFWWVPFTDHTLYVPLLSRLNVLAPILLGALVFWFSWRLVNWPTFADFLIATEAEMNKVSWTSRKRLVADTVVVLVTVFLFTVFLFTVDIIWFKVLSWEYINVLHVDLRKEQAKQQEKTQW